MPPAEQVGRLHRAVDRDAHQPQHPAVEPVAPAQPRTITDPVRVVADQHGLRTVDGDAPGADRQSGAVLMRQHVGQQPQDGADLVVAVRRTPHDLRVRAEGRVVDEDAPSDAPEVHPELHPVGEGFQAPRRVVPVEPEVQGEVVARPGRNHHERHPVLRRHTRHQRLRPVTTRRTEQVRAPGDGLTGEPDDVPGAGRIEQHHVSAERLRLLLQPETPHLSAARARIHQQTGTFRRRDRTAGSRAPHRVRPQRGPARDGGQRP